MCFLDFLFFFPLDLLILKLCIFNAFMVTLLIINQQVSVTGNFASSGHLVISEYILGCHIVGGVSGICKVESKDDTKQDIKHRTSPTTTMIAELAS